jgi:hypothetical protein
MTLAEARAEQKKLHGKLRHADSTLEGLVQARKRAHALIDRLGQGAPSHGERDLIQALRRDVQGFSHRIANVRAKRKEAETHLQRVKKWIARHKPSRGKLAMYDDVTISLIPDDAKAVAGYVNGLYTTWPAILSQFPRAKKLSIAVSADHDADCLDVEPGDATPAQAPAWIKRQKGKPVIYCSVSQAASVLSELARAGVKRSDVKLWTAHYDAHAHICTPACGFGMPTTADATQWTDHALERSLDESLCSGSFFN